MLAGCTGSGGRSATTTPQPPTTSSTSATPSTPVVSTSSTPSGSVTVTADTARLALLTLQDVGPGFTKARFKSTNDRLPCTPSDPPLEQQIPSDFQVGTAFIRQGAVFGEDLRVYADAATAGQVIARAAAGLDCPGGKLNLTGKPTMVHFGKVQNITSAVGADLGVAVPGTMLQYSLVLVGCQVGNAAVLFSFVRTKSTPTSSLPNPITIVSTAVQKIKNA